MKYKLVDELYANDYSTYLENLSLPLIYTLQMEDTLSKQQLRINYSKEDQHTIEKTILNLDGDLRISYCYMMLKSFSDFEEQNFEDSKLFQDTLQNSHQKSQKLKYEEFQFIQRLVNYINISLKVEQSQFNEQIFTSAISNDLLLIYLIYFIKYYRQYVEFSENQIIKDFDYGIELSNFHSLQQSNVLSEAFLRVWYDFLKISLSNFFSLKNEERLFVVFQAFMNYFYSKIESQSQLLFIERTVKVKFLDFFFFSLDNSQVEKAYTQIKSLTEQQEYNQYIFDLNCLICSWIISRLELQTEICKFIIQDFFNSALQNWWIYLPQLIISHPQRISRILVRIMNSEQQALLEQWQREILKIIQQMLFRENVLEKERYKHILIFTFLLLRKLKKHNERFFKEVFVSIPYQFIRDMEVQNLVYSVMTKQKEFLLLPVTVQSSFFTPNLFKIKIPQTLEFFRNGYKSNPNFLKQIFENFFSDLRITKNFSSLEIMENLTFFHELLQIMKEQVHYSFKQQVDPQEKQFIIQIYTYILEFVLSSIQDEVQPEVLDLSFEQFISIFVTNENWKCEVNCCLIQKILLQYDRLNYFLDLNNNYKMLSLIIMILVRTFDSMVKFIKQKPTQLFIRKIGKIISPILITIFQNIKIIGSEKIQFLLKILSIKDIGSLIKRSSIKQQDNFSYILLSEIQAVILGAVFESELETQFKLQVLEDIALVLQTRQVQSECCDTLNNKLIILLAIQENNTEDQKKVSEKIIKIIKKSFESSFKNEQFLNLLRLVLGKSHQSLLFEQRNDLSKWRSSLSLLQNQEKIQLEFKEKYNYFRVLNQFIEIFQHILKISKMQQREQNQAYLSFVDATSIISLPINLDLGDNFTVYFEVEFKECFVDNYSIADIPQFSIIPYRHLYQEILTFYNKQTVDEQSGFQILILQSNVKIRWFNLNLKRHSRDVEEYIFECQTFKKSEKYTFQISFSDKKALVFINNQLCKSEKQQNKSHYIQKIIKIDFGKSLPYAQSVSVIFGEQSILYEDQYFQGKLLNFWLSRQQIIEPVSKLPYIKKETLLDFSDQTELQTLMMNNISNEKIISKKVVKVISNITDVFVQNKIHISFLLIIQETIQEQNCVEITRLIDLLLDEIVFLDPQILDDFFLNFNYFQIILTKISKIRDLTFFYLLSSFLSKLKKEGQKYYQFFYKNVFSNFLYFEKWLTTQDNLHLFLTEGLKVSDSNLEQLIIIFVKNAQSKFITEWDIYQLAILEQFSIKYQQNQEDIISKQLSSDLRLLSQFFIIQQLNTRIYNAIIKIFFNIQQVHQKQLQKYLQKYSQGVLLQKQEFESFALYQFLQQIYIRSFQISNDSEINFNFIHFLLFIEDINQNFNKSEKYQINQYLQIIIDVKPKLLIKKNEIVLIQRFLERISNTKVLCSYINIINCYLSDSCDKIGLIEILCNKIFQQNQLYEIQNQSEIENILTKQALYKNFQQYTKIVFGQIFKNRFIYSELSKQGQQHLLNIITTDQEGFFVIFQVVLDLLSKGQAKSNPIMLINIIKFLWLIEFDCFRESDTYDQNIADKLLLIIEIMHQLQLFSFVEKWPRDENSKNQNSPQYGGLFRIFTNILLQAADRNKYQIVIDCAIKLLEVFYETLKQDQTNSRLVNDVYGFFYLKQDSKSIQFPILPYLFEKHFKPEKEFLEQKMEKLQFLIGKSKYETEQYFNNQKKSLKEEMMKEFEKGNCKSLSQKELLNHGEKLKETSLNCSTSLFSEICLTTTITSSYSDFLDHNYFTYDFSPLVNESSIKEFALNFYFNYNLWDQEKIFFEKIVDQDNYQKNGGLYQLVHENPWIQSNKQNFENTIYFSKTKYVLENQENNFQAIIGHSFQQSVRFESVQKFDQRMSENSKSITQIQIKIQDINGRMKYLNIDVQESIEFDDPFSNERVELNQYDTHITLVKYQQEEIAALIRKQKLDFQHLFFIIFKEQEEFSFFLKCCKEKNIQFSKYISNDLREVLVERWSTGKLSNYQYIFLLNYYSGRNIQDKNNYYIYPWTTIQFNESSLKLDRNLSESIFSIKFKNLQKVFPYYSNTKQIEYFFNPETQQLLEFLQKLQEKGEAVPELYSNCQLFENFKFPSWVQTQTPEEFIYIMRMKLESIEIQNQLHKWIDLVFGVYSTSQSNMARNLRLHPSIFQDQQGAINHNQNNRFEYGQSSRQLFTNFHIQRKITFDYFETQTMHLNYKKLLFEGINNKIISIYYFTYKAILVIYENGVAVLFKIQERSFIQTMTLKDLMSPSKMKKLETTQLLKQQQICFVDMENQDFSDNQESQYHIVEKNAKFSLSLSNPAIGFFIAGYEAGYFRLFEGLNMKQTIFSTPDKSQITCISINHFRKTLVIGQKNSKITLWNITKKLELNPDPYLTIKSHSTAISIISVSASKILSISENNIVQIHLYDGKLIQAFQLDTNETIKFCQISYTMNLYIFLDCGNNLLAYNLHGNQYLLPIEFVQDIKTIIPITPFCSQFLYVTSDALYFDDIFLLKMKQDGIFTEKEQENKNYNIEFQALKYMRGEKLLMPDSFEKTLLQSCIVINVQSSLRCFKFLLIGSENGKLWQVSDENDTIQYIKRKFEKSGITNEN